MTPVMEQWGPWDPALDETERRACIRALRQTGRLLTGRRGAEFCHWLAKAETDPSALEPARHALNAMAATDKRQIWAAYAGLINSAA